MGKYVSRSEEQAEKHRVLVKKTRNTDNIKIN